MDLRDRNLLKEYFCMKIMLLMDPLISEQRIRSQEEFIRYREEFVERGKNAGEKSLYWYECRCLSKGS